MIIFKSMDYKNTNILMVPEQKEYLIIKDVNNFPLDKFKFNIFAWQIIINQIKINQQILKFQKMNTV